MNQSKALFYVVFLISVLYGAVSTQAQIVPEEIAKAKDAIKGIIAYPPETRLAILEISQEPKLLVEIGKTGKLPDMAGYPQSIQDAAKELVQYPEAIEILNDHIALVAIVGRLYSRTGGETLGIADKLAEAMGKQEDAEKEKWIDLLKQNQKALEEFAEAVEALNEAQAASAAGGTAVPAAGAAAPAEGAAAGTGEAYEETAPAPEPYYQAEVSGNECTIYSGPTGEMVDYLLANADQYAEAAAKALEYWQQYPSGEVANALLQDLSGIATAADLIGDPGLLREVGQLRKEFPNAKDRLTDHRERIENIAGRRGDFPGISKRVDGFGDRNPQHRLNEWRKNPRPTKRATPRINEQPRRRRGSGSRPTSIRPGTRNKRQRVGAGANHHRKSWSSGSRGGRSRGSRGGGRSGGGRGGTRGGGRRR